MFRSGLAGQRLLALFALGVLLLNYPLLSLFEGPVQLLGIPLIYLYVFAAWGALIALLAFVIEGRSE